MKRLDMRYIYHIDNASGGAFIVSFPYDVVGLPRDNYFNHANDKASENDAYSQAIKFRDKHIQLPIFDELEQLENKTLKNGLKLIDLQSSHDLSLLQLLVLRLLSDMALSQRQVDDFFISKNGMSVKSHFLKLSELGLIAYSERIHTGACKMPFSFTISPQGKKVLQSIRSLFAGEIAEASDLILRYYKNHKPAKMVRLSNIHVLYAISCGVKQSSEISRWMGVPQKRTSELIIGMGKSGLLHVESRLRIVDRDSVNLAPAGIEVLSLFSGI